MLLPSARIVIVGGGVIGAAIFERLSAEYPRDVVLLEKNTLASGATGKSAGIARTFQSDQPLHPFDAYRNLLARSLGHEGVRMPTVHITNKRDNAMTEEVAPAQSVPVSYPQIRIRYGETASVEAGSGYYDPRIITRVLAALGRARGGLIHQGVEVREPIIRGDAVVGVRTSLGDLMSQVVVLAAGAWMQKLSASWGLGLSIVARAIQLNRYTAPAKVPQTPIFIDDPLDLYGRGDGEAGVLIGMPVAGGTVDPDLERTVSEHHAQHTWERARERFSWANEMNFHSAMASCDGYTTDGLPLIQRHPQLSGLYIAAGFSGGGFKQAPFAARTISALLRENHNGDTVCE